jgi:hypothetical protein
VPNDARRSRKPTPAPVQDWKKVKLKKLLFEKVELVAGK